MRKAAIRLVELGKVRGRKLAKLYEEARSEAKSELEKNRNSPLFLAGLMLYFAVGDLTTKHQVRLSNTDPALISTYLGFLERACGIPSEKIRIQLSVYPEQDPTSNERFWAFATGIPLARFTKSVVQRPRKGLRGGQGVCTVIVSSAYLKAKLLEWIALLPRELMKRP